MKRFIYPFFIIIFVTFYSNTINTFAQFQSKTLTQGIYNVGDAKLLIGTSLTIKITPSTSKAIVIIIDSNQTIESLVRLNPQVTQQVLPPLNYDYSIIIFSDGGVIFS